MAAVSVARPRTAAGLPRLLAGLHADGRALTLAEHHRVHGPLPRGRRELIALVQRVGLRGRGGAGFPLAAKLAAVAGRRSPVVVVNGAESEPGSRKDAVLLSGNPHLVLDGAVLAAGVVGARQVVVWLHQDPHGPPSPVEAAIDERSDPVLLRVEYGPPRYVAGQSSAAVNHLSGGRALPTLTPPHASERGVAGRPTLVSNVETLAQLALLARHGERWFRTVGTQREPGSLLVTLTGAVRSDTVLEVPFGVALGQVIEAVDVPFAPRAVLVGGYAGTWLPWPDVADLPLTTAELRAAGASLGVGMIAVLPGTRCGLAETAHLAGWLAGENAGQCGPCVNGLPAIASAMLALATGTHDRDTVARLHRWSAMVTGRGLCHHPDGVAALVTSALRVFRDEVAAHLAGWCSGAEVRPLLPVRLAHERGEPA